MSEAGPSNPRPRPHKKGKRMGGNGKKGKIFLEDRSGLLDLIGSVTDSKEAESKGKLAKQRKLNAKYKKRGAELGEAGPGGGGDEGDLEEEDDEDEVKGVQAVSASEQKRREKQRALAEAKAAVILAEQEKKRRKKIASGKIKPPASKSPKKKSVEFA